jgi:hypothetical protein
MKVITVRLTKIISEREYSLLVFSNKDQIKLQGSTAAVDYTNLVGLPRTTVIRILEKERKYD